MDENVDPGNLIATCSNLQEQGVTTPPFASWLPPPMPALRLARASSGLEASQREPGWAMVDGAGEGVLDMHPLLGSDSGP